jgi:hypothetical protein
LGLSQRTPERFDRRMVLIPSRGLGRDVVRVLLEAGFRAAPSARLGALIVLVSCDAAACEEVLQLARKVDPGVVHPQ